MEHRWDERHPVKINVVIHGDSVGLMRGRTGDLGMSGAFIHSAGASSVRQNGLLRLAFAVAGRIKIVRARVCRVVQGGFAVTFETSDRESLNNVELLLQAHGAPALAAAKSA